MLVFILVGNLTKRDKYANILPKFDNVVYPTQMSLLQTLQIAGRKTVDPEGTRMSLFNRKNPDRVGTGSILRIIYKHCKSATKSTVFDGVLIAVRRSPGDPTFIVRGIVDDVGVEQLFCLHSPLIEKIEVLKAARKRSFKKLYHLADNPIELKRYLK